MRDAEETHREACRICYELEVPFMPMAEELLGKHVAGLSAMALEHWEKRLRARAGKEEGVCDGSCHGT